MGRNLDRGARAEALKRLADAWVRYGGRDQSFVAFVQEAAAVSEASDATLVLPDLGVGRERAT